MPNIYKDNVPIKRADTVFQKIAYLSTKPRSLDIIERIGGDIRSGSLEYFFNHVLPPMKLGLDVDRVYNSCIKGKILSKKRGSKEYTWKGVRKNLKDAKAQKVRFVNILRTVTEAAWKIAPTSTSGVSTSCFDILDSVSEVKSRRNKNKNKDPDAVIYLGNSLEGQPNISEERRLCATSFSFHFKNSSSKEDTYDVRYILYIMNDTNDFYL